MKLTFKFKKILLATSSFAVVGGIIVTTCATNSNAHAKVANKNIKEFIPLQNELQVAGAYEWDELQSVENEIENQQFSYYGNLHPEWNWDDIEFQISQDDYEYYDTYYKPNSSNDDDNIACYNYLFKFAQDNKYDVVSWKYISSIQDDVVQEVAADVPGANIDDLTAVFEQNVSKAREGNLDPKTFTNILIKDCMKNGTEVSKASLLRYLVGEFTQGEFSSSTIGEQDQDVVDFINTNSGKKLIFKPTDVNIDNIASKLIDYTWFDSANPYEGDIYSTPLNDFNISVSARIVCQGKLGDYYLIKQNDEEMTNDMHIVFTFKDGFGNSVDVDKMFNFDYTTLQIDAKYNSFLDGKHGKTWQSAQLIDRNYDQFLWNPHTSSYYGFDKQKAIDNDDWYKQYGHAINFNYAVGDILPDDFTDHFLKVSYGQKDFNIPDGDATDTLSDTAAFFKKNGQVAGKFVARVSQINVSTDEPFVRFDLCYQYDTPDGPVVKLVNHDTCYGGLPIATGCDNDRIDLYWTEDEMETLNVADTYASTTIKDLDYLDKIGSNKDGATDNLIKQINDYTDWELAYIVAEGTLSGVLGSVAMIEAAAAISAATTFDFPTAVVLSTSAALNGYNSAVCAVTAATTSVNMDELFSFVDALSKFTQAWSTFDIENALANLHNHIDAYKNSKTFADYYENAVTITIDGDTIFDLVGNEITDFSNTMAKAALGDDYYFDTTDIEFINDPLVVSVCLGVAASIADDVVNLTLFPILIRAAGERIMDDAWEAAAEYWICGADERAKLMRDGGNRILKTKDNPFIKAINGDKYRLTRSDESTYRMHSMQRKNYEVEADEFNVENIIWNTTFISIIITVVQLGLAISWPLIQSAAAKDIVDAINNLIN